MIQTITKALIHELRTHLPSNIAKITKDRTSGRELTTHPNWIHHIHINLTYPKFGGQTTTIVFYITDTKITFQTELRTKIATYDLNNPTTTIEKIAQDILTHHKIPHQNK